MSQCSSALATWILASLWMHSVGCIDRGYHPRSVKYMRPPKTNFLSIGQDYTPFPPSGEDPPIYVIATGEADCDRLVTTANSMPWWFHTLHNDKP
jgi:hypothetical protein